MKQFKPNTAMMLAMMGLAMGGGIQGMPQATNKVEVPVDTDGNKIPTEEDKRRISKAEAKRERRRCKR